MGTNKRSALTNLVVLMFFSGLLMTGCNNATTSLSSSSDNLADEQAQPVSTEISNKVMFDNLPKLKGIAKIEMIVKGSPVDLVQKGVYDGLVFHRVIKSPQPFVAQGGDPQGKDPNFPVARLGTGGYEDESGNKRLIPLEIKLQGDSEPTYSKGLGQQSGIASPKVVLKHDRGSLAMARSAPPDSASAQFYISLADLEFLDGDYAVFGKVVEGMDVVDSIDQGDRIESAKVISGAENLK